MELAHLIAFNLALFAALISPGPAMLVAMRASLTGGGRTGVAVGAGLASMAALWTFAALMGLDAIFALFPWAYTSMKLAGGAYLIWIAVQSWRHATQNLDQTKVSTARSYLSGFLVNLGNPKSVLFAAAVLVVIFPPDLSKAQSLIIAANQLVVEFSFYTIFALVLSTPAVSQRYLRLKPMLDRLSAVVLGGLGLRLILSRS